MIANSAFLAAMTLMLIVFALMGELEFLVPYKRLIFTRHWVVIVGSGVVLFINLFAFFYLAGRGLFLKETGRKLAHVERQLRTGDSIVRDLSERLAKDR
jgi:hypothetical protein